MGCAAMLCTSALQSQLFPGVQSTETELVPKLALAAAQCCGENLVSGGCSFSVGLTLVCAQL